MWYCLMQQIIMIVIIFNTTQTLTLVCHHQLTYHHLMNLLQDALFQINNNSKKVTQNVKLKLIKQVLQMTLHQDQKPKRTVMVRKEIIFT